MSDERKRPEGESGHSRDGNAKSSMTRREWLLGAGGAALAASLPALPASAQEDSAVGHVDPASVNLPPGLYQPSPTHLAHALESDEIFHAIPSGSETDYARPLAGEFKPSFFSQGEFSVIRSVVSILLGLPEVPGSAAGKEDAVDAVARFIDLQVGSARGISEASRALSPQHKTLALHYYGSEAVNNLETSDPGMICREGLAWLDATSRQRHGARFLDLALPEQIEMVKMMSDGEADGARQNQGSRFFHLLKNETIRGYYTSRVGLRELGDKSHSFHAVSPGCPKSGHP